MGFDLPVYFHLGVRIQNNVANPRRNTVMKPLRRFHSLIHPESVILAPCGFYGLLGGIICIKK